MYFYRKMQLFIVSITVYGIPVFQANFRPLSLLTPIWIYFYMPTNNDSPVFSSPKDE